MKITDLDDFVRHFSTRVLQDALNEATAAYWLKRAETFEAVGNARCDEIAIACRNRASLALAEKNGRGSEDLAPAVPYVGGRGDLPPAPARRVGGLDD